MNFDTIGYRPRWFQLENMAERTGRKINRKYTLQKKVMVNSQGFTEKEWIELEKAEAGEDHDPTIFWKDMFPYEEVKKFNEKQKEDYRKALNKCLY